MLHREYKNRARKHLSNIVLEALANAVRHEKKIKGT